MGGASGAVGNWVSSGEEGNKGKGERRKKETGVRVCKIEMESGWMLV